MRRDRRRARLRVKVLRARISSCTGSRLTSPPGPRDPCALRPRVAELRLTRRARKRAAKRAAKRAGASSKRKYTGAAFTGAKRARPSAPASGGASGDGEREAPVDTEQGDGLMQQVVGGNVGWVACDVQCPHVVVIPERLFVELVAVSVEAMIGRAYAHGSSISRAVTALCKGDARDAASWLMGDLFDREGAVHVMLRPPTSHGRMDSLSKCAQEHPDGRPLAPWGLGESFDLTSSASRRAAVTYFSANRERLAYMVARASGSKFIDPEGGGRLPETTTVFVLKSTRPGAIATEVALARPHCADDCVFVSLKFLGKKAKSGPAAFFRRCHVRTAVVPRE